MRRPGSKAIETENEEARLAEEEARPLCRIGEFQNTQKYYQLFRHFFFWLVLQELGSFIP